MINIAKTRRLVKRKKKENPLVEISENLEKLTDCLTENLSVLTASVVENAEQFRITF